MQSDVDEALRLMRMSKISLTDEAGGRGGVDAISAIYSRVRDDATARRKATYAWAELTALAGQDFTVRVDPNASSRKVTHSRTLCRHLSWSWRAHAGAMAATTT